MATWLRPPYLFNRCSALSRPWASGNLRPGMGAYVCTSHGATGVFPLRLWRTWTPRIAFLRFATPPSATGVCQTHVTLHVTPLDRLVLQDASGHVLSGPGISAAKPCTGMRIAQTKLFGASQGSPSAMSRISRSLPAGQRHPLYSGLDGMQVPSVSVGLSQRQPSPSSELNRLARSPTVEGGTARQAWVIMHNQSWCSIHGPKTL